MTPSSNHKVVIVGAGPVGSLAALYAAARGDEVEVYELRGASEHGLIRIQSLQKIEYLPDSVGTFLMPRDFIDLRDPSTIPLNFTKSINLALSERGINAMRHTRRDHMIQKILGEAIPVYGRMIHGRHDEKLWEASQAYDVHGRHINAADRGHLNNALLDELEQTPNVKLFFNHKLTGADFRAKKAWFEQRTSADSTSRAPEVEISFDYLIGADGAHSISRYHMMKYARVDYHQQYIDALWCEFHIPPTEEGEFRISPDHLHIWPGKEFMFIALPSADKSFTCTLFASTSYYTLLERSPKSLLDSFDKNFPGVCPDLITPADLQTQFETNPHLPLISIKCSPFHFDSSAVIVGDAAHAVVPFYGQGLNAGLEDIRVLFECLDQHGVYDLNASPESRALSRQAALQAYTDQRTKDAHAINDLSKDNYIEMRWGVQLPLYKLRKSLEETLDRYLPSLGWQTQYVRISFSTQPYSEVIKAVQRQGTLLLYGSLSAIISSAAVVGVLAWNYPMRISLPSMLQSPIQQLCSAWKNHHR